MHQKKEENLRESQTPPMVSENHPKQSINGETSRTLCRKAKTKVETSSLRNLKTMPRNLNEIILL